MKLLTLDELDSIERIASKYEQLVKESVQFPKALIEVLKDWMDAGHIRVGLTTIQDDIITGFGVVVPSRDRILVIYADDRDGELDQSLVEDNEKQLLDWCLSQLEKPPIRIEFPRLTENLKMELLNRGYTEYERASMIVSRSRFLENQEIPLPDEFQLVQYIPEKRERSAHVLAEANTGHVDAIIYPEFFGSKEVGIEFLKKLEEGAFGEYNEGESMLLQHNEEIIGYCLIAKTGNQATIPDLALAPAYQGKGLGKALLVNTILALLKSNDAFSSVHLAVTLSNPARYLYEKVGFSIEEEFSSIIYTGTK